MARTKRIIPHNRPTLGKDEERAVTRILRSGWMIQGMEVKAFEDELCEYLGLPEGHAVMVSSGTAALYLAVRYLWNRPSITYPIYSCSSLRNAIIMANRKPIEAEMSNPNQDIICHIFGTVNPILTYPMKRGIKFIEDSAQSLGAKINNDYVGTIGTFGVFSFSATKLITSGGQGGAVVSTDKSRIEEIRDFRDFDMRGDFKQRFNFGMTDIQAAIGRVQLKNIKFFLERREEIFQRYLNAGLDLIRNNNKHIIDVRYRAVLKTGKQLKIISALGRKGINAIIPIEEFEIPNVVNFPESYRLTKNTVSLPIYPTLSDKHVDLIISVVKKYL